MYDILILFLSPSFLMCDKMLVSFYNFCLLSLWMILSCVYKYNYYKRYAGVFFFLMNLTT